MGAVDKKTCAKIRFSVKRGAGLGTGWALNGREGRAERGYWSEGFEAVWMRRKSSLLTGGVPSVSLSMRM